MGAMYLAGLVLAQIHPAQIVFHFTLVNTGGMVSGGIFHLQRRNLIVYCSAVWVRVCAL